MHTHIHTNIHTCIHHTLYKMHTHMTQPTTSHTRSLIAQQQSEHHGDFTQCSKTHSQRRWHSTANVLLVTPRTNTMQKTIRNSCARIRSYMNYHIGHIKPTTKIWFYYVVHMIGDHAVKCMTTETNMCSETARKLGIFNFHPWKMCPTH